MNRQQDTNVGLWMIAASHAASPYSAQQRVQEEQEDKRLRAASTEPLLLRDAAAKIASKAMQHCWR